MTLSFVSAQKSPGNKLLILQQEELLILRKSQQNLNNIYIAKPYLLKESINFSADILSLSYSYLFSFCMTLYMDNHM